MTSPATAVSGEAPVLRRAWNRPGGRTVLVAGAVLLVLAAAGGLLVWLDDGPPEAVEIIYRDARQRTLVADRTTAVRRNPVPLHGKPPQATMVQVVLSPVGAGQAGVFCHGDGPDGYFLGLTGTGRAIIDKTSGGRTQTLVATASRRSRGGTLTAVCVTEKNSPLVRLTLWLGGERLIETADGRNAVSPGAVGIMVRAASSGPDKVSVAFDDLIVSRF